MRLLLCLGFSLALGACSGKESDDGDGEIAHPESGACSMLEMRALSSCTEYVGITAADWKEMIGDDGTYCQTTSTGFASSWSEGGTCTKKDTGGGCRRTHPSGMVSTTWHFRGMQSQFDESVARKQCQPGDEFIPAPVQ